MEYAFRRASDVLAKAIGGTLRDARDAALLGLSEVIQFDLVPGDEEADWIADALNALLPAIPGGAIFDAALERLNPQPTVPVSKPADAPPADTSAENLPTADATSATAAFAALDRRLPSPPGGKDEFGEKLCHPGIEIPGNHGRTSGREAASGLGLL